MKMKHLLKKAFLLLALVGGVNSAWADEAILSWNMGADGAAATSANSITGASGCAAEGFTIAITGNQSKNWSNGNGSITYNEVTYTTLKNSNGAQNTVTCPKGKLATKITFYATSNADAAGKLSEIDGQSCSDEVSSLKDYENPTVITKNIDNKESFTFTFSTKQVCFIAVITYKASNDPAISAASPASIKATESGVEVTEDIAVTGANLTGSTLTATLSPAVAGLSVTLGSSTITDGAISTTATLHYTATENAIGSTTLTLSDGTTSKEVTVNYNASVVTWELQTINSSRTWDFSKLTGGKQYSGGDLTVEHVYAGISEIGFSNDFDETALAFTGEFPLRADDKGVSKGIAQNGTLRFNTSVPGYIVVKFSDTGTKASSTAVKRYLVVNDVTTEYWASRENNNEDPEIAYPAQLDVTTGPLAVPAGDVTIAGTSAIVYSKVEFVPAVSKTITSAGWATFCSDKALDFSGVAGLTAYIITGTESGNTLALSAVSSVPANTGVLLEGAAGDYMIPVVASADAVEGNKLVGVTEDTPISAKSAYVLMGSPKVGFYQNNNGFTVGANTAYLPANFAGGAAREAYFFDVVTGVEAVEAAPEAVAKEGKFIVDGKLRIFSKGKMFNANGQLVK